MRPFLFMLALVAAMCKPFLCFSAPTALFKDSVECCDPYDLRELLPVRDAYLALAKAAESNDLEALKRSSEAIKSCHITDFALLECIEGDDSCSFNGHLIYNEFFADSLANGKNAYDFSDIIKNGSEERGPKSTGNYLGKHCLVKARGKNVYKFLTSGYQELLIMAEPKGKITTRVHVINKTKNIDKWFNDKGDLPCGRNLRQKVLPLPETPYSTVILEVINCCDKNISFVVVSN